MGFSFERYTLTSGTVATPVFGYGTIALLESNDIPHSDQLVMSLNGNTLTFTTDYTIDEGAEEVTIVGATAAALVVGDIFIIQRDTKDDARYVDYTNNSAIDSDDLDLDSDQLFFLIQEAADKTDQVINLDLTTDRWNGLGKSTYNFGPAEVGDGLTTLAQVQSLIGAGEVTSINKVETFVFETGVDGTTTYTMTDAGLGFSDPSKLIVTVNAVLQIPDYDTDDDDTINLGSGSYTVINADSVNPQLVFHEAPNNESVIVVRTISGIVNALLNTEIVDGGAIANGSLDLSAIGFTGSGNNRFIVINTSNVASVGTVSLSQLTAPTGSLSVSSQKITNLADPVDPTDAVNLRSIPSAADAASRLDLNDNAIISSLSLPHNFATGKNDGLWLITLTYLVTDRSGSASNYTVSATVNGVTFTGFVVNHPDGTQHITISRFVTVSGGTITLSATSGISHIASIAGYKVG